MNSLFDGRYRGKRVLITGHTGFKGSWLALWLNFLGAEVIGYSSYLPSSPCHFVVSRVAERAAHLEGDIRDFERLRRVFQTYRPEVVFHLAAQPLVRRSYEEPKLTFDTNVGGTVNVLECIRTSPSVAAAVMITSDKCYRNFEWPWGYREHDVLGGEDPYGGSKGAAELACHSYVKSFFHRDASSVHLATARAGNVIGGGDWADARIIPDCVRAWSVGKPAMIRNPTATRPWQHVLEPLSGYLWLGANLLQSERVHGEAFNFGPRPNVDQSVEELINAFAPHWPGARIERDGVAGTDARKENTLLKLSCDKALSLLGWSAVLSFEETARFTAEWYRAYYAGGNDMHEVSCRQIASYTSIATARHRSWATENSEETVKTDGRGAQHHVT